MKPDEYSTETTYREATELADRYIVCNGEVADVRTVIHRVRVQTGHDVTDYVHREWT